MIRVDQIKITINDGVGGRRRDMLKRRIVGAIKGYMSDASMYNKTAREIIRFDIDIKVTFNKQ